MLIELEYRYQELEIDHRHLCQDKALILAQVRHLQEMLSREKMETQRAKVLLEAEQQRVVNAQNEIFKFRRSLNEANDMISKLNWIRTEREQLVRGIRSVQDVLQLNERYKTLGELQEEISMQLISHQFEKSLFGTLLEHFGREVHEVMLDRENLKRENAMKSEELHELRGRAEFLLSQLTDLMDSHVALKKEIVILSQKLKAPQIDFNAILSRTISQDIFGMALKSICREMCEGNISLKQCDFEIEGLLGNIKSAMFGAVLCKGKVLEMILICESFEISVIVQREVLEQEQDYFVTSLIDEKKHDELLTMKNISDDDFSQVNNEQMLNSSFSLNFRGEKDREKVHCFRQKNMCKNDSGSIIGGNSGSFSVESWELAGGERGSGKRKKLNVRLLMQRDMEFECPKIDLVLYREGDMREKRPSVNQMPEKELGVDKEMIPREVFRAELHQEWKKNIVETLFSDSQRLMELQSGFNELKSSIGLSEAHNCKFTRRQKRSITVQMRKFEGTILKLIKTNIKLSKKVDEFDVNLERESCIATISKRQKKILDRARKASEEIRRLKMKFQKVHHMLLINANGASGIRGDGVGKRLEVLLV
jgi:hypothetical protein